MPQLIKAFQREIAQDSELFALSLQTTDAPYWSVWEPIRSRMGFEVLPVEYAKLQYDIPIPFRSVSQSHPDEIQIGPYRICSLEVAGCSSSELATCYNQAFFGGEPKMMAASIEQMLASSIFCPSLSFAFLDESAAQPVGFLFSKRWGQMVEIDLLGIAPEHRRQGLVRNSIQFLSAAMVKKGVSSAHWELNTNNAPIHMSASQKASIGKGGGA